MVTHIHKAGQCCLASAKKLLGTRFSHSGGSRSLATMSTLSEVDLRSDTVTKPSRAMLETALTAKLGDDVFGEDPTVLELESYMAELAGKEASLFVPSGTMANLVAILAHCDRRSSEIILGSNSHISLWEAGNAASLGGVHTRQLPEDLETGLLHHDDLRDSFRLDNDDHCAKTALVCLENTHNMMGGIAISADQMNATAQFVLEQLDNTPIHVDGARIFNAVVAQKTTLQEMCRDIDSISICFSKGLGAPLGSVLVGDREMIRLAKRARKRCGGGMRQAGVVAAMGLYAVQHNVERLAEDHVRAQRLAAELHRYGFQIPRNGVVDTNIVYFAMPEHSTQAVDKSQFSSQLAAAFGVKIGGGYHQGGDFFRICTHMDVNDEDVDRAAEAIVKVSQG